VCTRYTTTSSSVHSNQYNRRILSTRIGVTHLPTPWWQVREELTTVLQQELVELIDLALVGKRLHSTAVDELFRPLHEQLDDLVASWDLWPTSSPSGLWPSEVAQTARQPPLSRAADGCQSSRNPSSLKRRSELSCVVLLKLRSVLATK
jgi:hypothetical protein